MRNAAHVAAVTGVAMDRGLGGRRAVGGLLILHQRSDNVVAAARPWAYLMSSAQKHVFDEVRAQQLLTNAASIRGRAREVLPLGVRPVGSTAADLATAFGHEPQGPSYDAAVEPRILRQVGRHQPPPLLAGPAEQAAAAPLHHREPWFDAFVDLLVGFGPDRAVTVAAVDRLADLFGATYVGWWEWAARRTQCSRGSDCRRTSAAPWSPYSPGPVTTGTTASGTACSPPCGQPPNTASRLNCC